MQDESAEGPDGEDQESKPLCQSSPCRMSEPKWSQPWPRAVPICVWEAHAGPSQLFNGTPWICSNGLPPWSPSQAPLKPPWSPSQAHPPWSPLETPLKPLQALEGFTKVKLHEGEALLKPPWSPLEAVSSPLSLLQALLKPPSSPLEARPSPSQRALLWFEFRSWHCGRQGGKFK